MMDMVNDTTAIILAGGKGRRMQAANKGLVKLGDKPLIGHVIERIKKQVAHIIISANADIPQYASFGYPVISDDLSEFQGPLAGIHSALKATTTRYAIIMPCDSPFIPEDFVVRMAQGYQASKAEVSIVNDGERTQPLFMFLETSQKSALEKTLKQGTRKVYSWLKSMKSSEIDFSDRPRAFININTPEELVVAGKNL